LDRATEENCLWVIPGSHQWSQERISLELNSRRKESFSTDAATPLCLEPGDILLRNTLLFNGAPPAFGKNQRIIHYEFRPVSLILKYNWFEQRFIDKKRAMLSRCVASRKRQAVTATDKPYPWPHKDDGEREFRFPQEDYGWTF
ncbi:MAG: phytanoyl-CoA dioxygenase family protein, partial [Planctomycetes bacterium]|nr:phytanoyl-CoA dioxygenase family protein [Planctomycetota bacterium]